MSSFCAAVSYRNNAKPFVHSQTEEVNLYATKSNTQSFYHMLWVTDLWISPCKFLQEVHFQGKQRTFNKNVFSQMPKIFLAVITYMQAIVPLKNDSYLFLQAGSVRPLFGPILRLFVPVYYMALKGKGWISLKIVQTFPPIQLGHLSNYFDLMRFYCSLERLTSQHINWLSGTVISPPPNTSAMEYKKQ